MSPRKSKPKTPPEEPNLLADMWGTDGLPLEHPGLEAALPIDLSIQKELREVEGAVFAAKRARQASQMDDSNDYEFVLFVIFQNRDQVTAFLAGTGWERLVEDDEYIDGMALASHLGVTLPVVPFGVEVGLPPLPQLREIALPINPYPAKRSEA